MDTQNVFLKSVRKCLYMGMAVALSSLTFAPLATADDTEVFLGSTASSDAENIRPNILFILDTSGSMDWSTHPKASTESKHRPPTSQYPKRITVMKEALIDLLGGLNNVNVGLMTFNTIGGPVRYPVSYIDGDAGLVESGGFNIIKPIAQSSDDAQENTDTLINPGTVNLNSAYLHATHAYGSANPTIITPTPTISNNADDGVEKVPDGTVTLTDKELPAHTQSDLGLRFRNITVPPGAIIIDAALTLTVDPDSKNDQVTIAGIEDEESQAVMRISAEASANSPVFTTASKNLSTRPRTAQYVDWHNVPAIASGESMVSPNLSQVIQEVVDGAGWASGNSLSLFIRTMPGYRDLDSRDGSTANAADLRISYTMDKNKIPKLTGLRFPNIQIPQGAKITRAFLDFEAAADSNEHFRYDIYGHKTADSPTFAATTNNISNRDPTSFSVTWELFGSSPWQSNQRYQTPDLKDVIQEIVNQNDWCGGNALSLIMRPVVNGYRLLKSFDGFGSGTLNNAPALLIEYDTDTANISAPNTGCMQSEIVARVNAGSDDAEETSNNTVATNETTLELVRSNSFNQTVGLRFQKIDLPKNAVILDSMVEFTAIDNDTSGSITLTVKGHKTANSPTFGGKSDITKRLTEATSASVDWNSASSPALSNWTKNTVYKSPNIGGIIQEIVNQSGWQANNSLSLIITGTGTGSNRRDARSYNSDAARAPLLRIKYQRHLAGQPGVTGQTVRERLIQEVENLSLVSGTPTVNTYMEALRYFRGMQVYWGKERGNQATADRYGRISHTASYTGGVYAPSSGCTNLDLNSDKCIKEAITANPVYKSPIVDNCQANYIVLLSDGEQSGFDDGDGISALVGSCSTANSGAECGVKMAKFAKTVDQKTLMNGPQTITTHTIGFTFTSGMLEDMASKAKGGDGIYKEASDAEELADAFKDIFGDILSKPSSFTAPTLTISAFNRLFNSDEIYISVFEPQRSARWMGNVKKYFLCTPAEDKDGKCTVGQLVDVNRVPAVADGHILTSAKSDWNPNVLDGPNVELGGAGMKIPDPADRRIYTYIAGGSNNSKELKLNKVATDNTDITTGILGVPTTPASARTDMINWIRGQDVDNEDGNTTTDQRWAFGDPLHSAAITINYGRPDDSTNPKDVVTKLFVGANDGGFRMINTKTGEEEWVFMPEDMLRKQKALRENMGGNDNHVYGMDGSPTAWIKDINGNSKIEKSDGDFVKVFIGQRRGGENYYALNVTPTTPVTNATAVGDIQPVLMWQINSGTPGFSRLAQTWSRPLRTQLLMDDESGNAVLKNVVIFGGGYDPANDINYGAVNPGAETGNAIYVVDADKGTLIWSASSASAVSIVPDMTYSIPADIRLLDMNGDGATDRLYVGDMGGQIWRVDFTGPLTANAKTNTVVGKLAALSDNTASTAPAVITNQRRFMYRPQVALLQGTHDIDGTPTPVEYLSIAINSGDREHPLAKHVQDRVYVLRDYAKAPMKDADNDGLADDFRTIKHSGNDLADVTSNVTTESAALLDKNNYGWYIDLKESGASGFVGEKGITEGQILISALPEAPDVYTFNTYTPSFQTAVSACSASLGLNRTYFINLSNGTGTTIIDEETKDRSKYNDAYGIAADPTVIQQDGQTTVSVGGGSTYNEEPHNIDLGDNLLPIYITE